MRVGSPSGRVVGDSKPVKSPAVKNPIPRGGTRPLWAWSLLKKKTSAIEQLRKMVESWPEAKAEYERLRLDGS